MAKLPYSIPQEEQEPAQVERELVWVGSSLDDLREFDPELRQAFGYQLGQVQNGATPGNAKPAEVAGTMKLVENLDGETYRVVYVTKLKTAVYVLHAFQKKSKSGIETPKQDIDRIEKRMKRAGELDKKREQERKK